MYDFLRDVKVWPRYLFALTGGKMGTEGDCPLMCINADYAVFYQVQL